MYFMIALANTDSYMLVTVNFPLHYTNIMNLKSCILLLVASCVVENNNALPHTLLTASLLFCGSKEVASFYCDTSPLLKLSSSNT